MPLHVHPCPSLPLTLHRRTSDRYATTPPPDCGCISQRGDGVARHPKPPMCHGLPSLRGNSAAKGREAAGSQGMPGLVSSGPFLGRCDLQDKTGHGWTADHWVVSIDCAYLNLGYLKLCSVSGGSNRLPGYPRIGWLHLAVRWFAASASDVNPSPSCSQSCMSRLGVQMPSKRPLSRALRRAPAEAIS